MHLQTTGLLGAVALVAGCASTSPPAFIVPTPHAALGGAAGPLLLSDGCIQRRVLVGYNFMVLSASDATATALERDTREHLARRGVVAAPPVFKTVCGVLFDAANPLKVHAETLDAPNTSSPQPLRVSPDVTAHGVDTQSWAKLLTELHAMGLASQRPADSDTNAPPAKLRLSDDTRALAQQLGERQGRRSLLFVGLSGNSESGGKIFAQTAALVGAGVVAGVLAGPATLAGLSTAQTVAINATAAAGAPFLSQDGWRVVGTLVSLPDGQLQWSRVVVGQADPLGDGVLNRASTTDRLLRRLLNQPAAAWSPPGVAK